MRAVTHTTNHQSWTLWSPLLLIPDAKHIYLLYVLNVFSDQYIREWRNPFVIGKDFMPPCSPAVIQHVLDLLPQKSDSNNPRYSGRKCFWMFLQLLGSFRTIKKAVLRFHKDTRYKHKKSPNSALLQPFTIQYNLLSKSCSQNLVLHELKSGLAAAASRQFIKKCVFGRLYI